MSHSLSSHAGKFNQLAPGREQHASHSRAFVLQLGGGAMTQVQAELVRLPSRAENEGSTRLGCSSWTRTPLRERGPAVVQATISGRTRNASLGGA